MATSTTGAKSSIPSGESKAGTKQNFALLGGLPPEKDVKEIDKVNMPKTAPGSIRKGA